MAVCVSYRCTLYVADILNDISVAYLSLCLTDRWLLTLFSCDSNWSGIFRSDHKYKIVLDTVLLIIFTFLLFFVYIAFAAQNF